MGDFTKSNAKKEIFNNNNNNNVKKVIKTENKTERIVKEMQKTVLMDSESIMRKVLLGVVQPE